MARVNSRRIQSHLYLWERKLLDRIRLMRKDRGSFIVLLDFSDDHILLHLVNKEKIALTKGPLTKEE